MCNNNPLETLMAFAICVGVGVMGGVMGTLSVQWYKKSLIGK